MIKLLIYESLISKIIYDDKIFDKTIDLWKFWLVK
jgi:hypothetical protein